MRQVSQVSQVSHSSRGFGYSSSFTAFSPLEEPGFSDIQGLGWVDRKGNGIRQKPERLWYTVGIACFTYEP
jgi:hypothetical protein